MWNEWNEENRTRDQFILFLKAELKKCVFGKEPPYELEDSGIRFWLNKIKDYDTENPTNWYETPQLEKILLLLDFIEHSQKKESGIPLLFLRPKYFKNYNEDQEHIYPSTPTQFKSFKKQGASVFGIKKYLNELNKGYEANNEIKWSCSESEWDGFLEEEKNNILSELKEQIHQKRPINSIGNLVLLHLSINRGFGNNYYADKRITVINNTENGEYVRHHTLKVFVKQTNNENISNWTMQDIKSNADKIHNTLRTFFNFNN